MISDNLPDLDGLILEIISLKARLDEFNVPSEWDNQFKDKIKKQITYHSNKIEGNTLTFGETLALLESNIIPKHRSIKDILKFRIIN
jgi:Fic family protein